jgi:5-formyltetrahydrofolate cyclo-ligase
MKQTLRAQLLKKRKALSYAEVLAKSREITHRLFTSSWYQKACTILFYVSYNNEVHTHEMIQDSLRNGKNVIVPKTKPKNKDLTLSRLLCWDDLCPGAYSILEPKDDCIRETSISTIDLCIIPGVAFDYQGNRIGHGEGYYDRLFQTKCVAHRIGLAFEFQIVDHIQSEIHDVRVEKIITEDRVIDCS